MDNLPRRLFNFAATASLVLLVGTLCLWVRSAVVGGEQVEWLHGQSQAVALSWNGCLVLDWTRPEHRGRLSRNDMVFSPSDPRTGWNHQTHLVSAPGIADWLWPDRSFIYWGEDTKPVATFYGEWQVSVPLWMLIVLTAVLPVLWVRRRLRLRAYMNAGKCLKCGYDLRATPDRCPECGAAAATESR